MSDLDGFLAQYPFELDDFQKDAIHNIEAGHSVVVFAPTGSGKTIIAEFCATKAIGAGKKLFYTTPLKALSNQKFHDLQKQYGEQNVGLLTGDVSINRDAWIVVMTTEIFRNMLYGIHEDSSLINQVGYLVLDECHYMNDPQRGTVWEETIIYCPEHIQMVALSATIANALELTDWINEVHHDTRLIFSDFRPVPLRFFYYDREQVLPLYEAPGKLNRKLKTHTKNNRFSRDKRGGGVMNKLIQTMHERDMLPAIFFSFSRREIENNLRETRFVSILTDFEKKQINDFIKNYLVDHPYLEGNPMLAPLRNGFACHHAGLLPGVKHIVEKLFQEGFIKVVFATETLAAGINMPARSTVITKISKRGDDGHRMLTANEFLQMSGRAGRRGMDKVGYVVVCSSQYEGAFEAATLASGQSDPLNSQFTPTYGMVLNILKKYTLEDAAFLIRKSFGQFTVARRLQPLADDIAMKTKALEELTNFQCPYGVSDEDFHNYLRSHALEVETAKFTKILKKQVKLHGAQEDIVKQLSQEEAKRDNLLSTMERTACHACDIINRHQKLDDRIRRLQKKLKTQNRFYDEEKDYYWQRFSRIYELLKSQGYLDDQNKPTDKGWMTSQIRAENEFFIAELILQNFFEELTPPQLAAVVHAITSDSERPRDFNNMRASVEIEQRVAEISKFARRIENLQNQHRVDAPITINTLACGLVEGWAQGLPWTRLTSATNIAEGDLVRMMRRTADMLRQLSRIQGIPEHIARTAKTALAGIHRVPIIEEEEKEAGVTVPVVLSSIEPPQA